MRKILKLLASGILATCYCTTACSQYYFYNEDYYESSVTWQTGVSAGAMNCLTDLGGRSGSGGKFLKDINWNNTRPAGSLFVGLNYKDLIGTRLELAFGQLTADDKVLGNDQSVAHNRYLRNLNFRSTIRELTFSIELFPLSLLKNSEALIPLIQPYFVVGIGYFSFRPETFYNNSWLNVSDFHTEGQGFDEFPNRKPYKLSQLNLPLGAGFKYELSPAFTVQFELIYRKLWTDYLDDVSNQYIDPGLFRLYFSPYKAALATKLADRRTVNSSLSPESTGVIRGNSNNNDTYFSGLVKLALVLGRQKR